MADMNLRTAAEWAKRRLSRQPPDPAAPAQPAPAPAAAPPASAAIEPGTARVVPPTLPPGVVPASVQAPDITRPAGLRPPSTETFQPMAGPAGPAGQGALRPGGGFGTPPDVWRYPNAPAAPVAPPFEGVPDSPIKVGEMSAGPHGANEYYRTLREPPPPGETLKPGDWVKPAADGLPRGVAPTPTPAAGRVGALPNAIGTQAEWNTTGARVANATSRLRSAAGAVGKYVLKPAPMLAGGYETYAGLRDGDMGKAGMGALDTAAGAALFSPAAPLAGTYLGARAAYQAPGMINNALGEEGHDAVGAVVNSGVRAVGNLFGQNWGASDANEAAYLRQKAAAAAAQPAPAAAPASAPEDSPERAAEMARITAQVPTTDAAPAPVTATAPEAAPAPDPYNISLTGDGRFASPPGAPPVQQQAVPVQQQTLRPQQSAPVQQQQAGAQPANPEVAAFQQQYGGAAARAGRALGVDPNLLLAQWGNETGWGKSVIPGTNNLGNIKDVSGRGVRATDNATGSNDAYLKFASPDAFADHFVGLMQRKYPGVAGTGADADKFTAALKGYAEDSRYGQKVKGAYAMLGAGQAPAGAPARQGLRADDWGPVHVIEGTDQFVEIPTPGGTARVPGDIWNAWQASGDPAAAQKRYWENKYEGALDHDNPKRIEGRKVDAELEMARATRAQTAAVQAANMDNLRRDNERADNAARDAASKALNEHLGNVLTTKDDKGNTVPDVARVGAAYRAMHDEVGLYMQDLEQQFPPGSPGYGKAQKYREKLGKLGVAALEPDDRARMLSQYQIKERAMATESPWLGGSSPVNDRLSSYAVNNDPQVIARNRRLFGSDVIELMNGTKIRANDLKYTEAGNHLFPNIRHVPTTEFDAGLRGK